MAELCFKKRFEARCFVEDTREKVEDLFALLDAVPIATLSLFSIEHF